LKLIDKIKEQVKSYREDYLIVNKVTGVCLKNKFRAKFEIVHEFTGQRGTRIKYFEWL